MEHRIFHSLQPYIHASKLIENALNLKDTKVFDQVINDDGSKTSVLNKKETMLASQKQELIKEEFKNFIFENPDRRYRLEKIYNEKFNSIRNRGENFTVKQLEKTKKKLLVRLEKLNDDFKKGDVITFEELEVDKLFIDEAHSYKNLYLYTKMRNVAGIGQSEAFKSSDMFMKCRYMDELTGGKGVVFATGTPVSNSMTELYTMQRYLQYEDLKKNGLEHFDSGLTLLEKQKTPLNYLQKVLDIGKRQDFQSFITCQS